MKTRLDRLAMVATLMSMMSSLLISTAQAYRVDPDFAPAPATRPGSIDVIAVQPDGKLLVGGHFHRVNGAMRAHMARLHPDGSPDPSFNLGGGLAGVDRELEGDPSRYLRSIVIQPDGKIVIAGHFLDVNGTFQPGVARLLNDGRLDASFRPVLKGLGGHPASIWGEVHKVFFRPEGKLIIAGGFWAVNGIARPGLAQLNQDGALDESFRPAPAYQDELRSLDYLGLQPNGKLVAFGNAFGHVQFNADGSRDSGFALSGSILGMTLEGFMLDDGVTFRRYTFDGKTDPGYRAPNLAKIFPRFLYRDDARMLSDGSILVSAALGDKADRANPKEYGLVRVLANGVADGNFNQGQPIPWEFGVLSDPSRDVALLDSRGGIVISHFENQGSKVFRLTPDGTRYANFRLEVQRVGISGTVASLRDDSLVFLIETPNVAPYWHLIKQTAQGTVTTDFSEQVTRSALAFPQDAIPIGITATPEGKFVLPLSSGTLMRLNGDGAIDGSFSAPPGLIPPKWTLSRVLSTSGGDIWVQIFQREPFKQEVIRVDGTGAKELSRFTLAGQSSLLAAPRDGKLLVAVYGDPRGLARLNADGSVDSTFAWGLGQQTPSSAVLLPDDKILVGGLRIDDPVVSNNYSGMARLHSDGRLDQILAFEVRGELRPGRRGERGLSLAPVHVQSDGAVIVQGQFTSIDGHVRLGVARLLPDTLIRLGKPSLSGGMTRISVDAAAGRRVVIESTPTLSPSNWQPLSTNTITTGLLTLTDPDAAKFPRRFYRAVSK